MTRQAGVKLSMEGESALLLDAAAGAFDDAVQARIWATAAAAQGIAGVRETVAGMNNLMVLFDPLAVDPERMEAALLDCWAKAVPGETRGRLVEVPVAYGGGAGEDLPDFAAHAGLSEAEAVRRHAAGLYSVAAIGFLPGFAYLSGLDTGLAIPRRATPRLSVPAGSVIVGGAQTGIMPRQAPSGWHIIGRTALTLFDPAREPAALLQPGDRVRFVPQ